MVTLSTRYVKPAHFQAHYRDDLVDFKIGLYNIEK